MAPVTKQDIDDAAQAVKKAEDTNKKLQPKFKETSSALDGAIEERNESMVRLYRPRLEKIAKEIADAIQEVELAISRVGVLQKDADFMEKRFDLVEKLLGGVSRTRTLLTKQLVECKKLDQKAVDSLGQLSGDQEDAASEYARLEDIANDLEAKLEQIRPLAKKHEDAAKKAFANKDQAALTAARMALLDFEFGKLKLVAQTNQPKIAAFQKKYPNSELKTEATWLGDKLETLRSELAGLDERTLALVRLGQVAAAPGADDETVADLDIAKAAKTLGIAAKDQPKLAKVLAGKPGNYEKGLATLAAELELEEQNGKKLLALLTKAKVLTA